MAIKLTRREKYAIYAASVFMSLFVLIQFIVFPLVNERERLGRTLAEKSREFEEIVALQSEYDALRRETELTAAHLAERESGFTLFSFLDKLAGQTGVKGYITYMKPSVTDQKDSPYKISMVEMELQAVTINQLISYLKEIETSKNRVKIKRISISKTGKQEQFINAVFQVETFMI